MTLYPVCFPTSSKPPPKVRLAIAFVLGLASRIYNVPRFGFVCSILAKYASSPLLVFLDSPTDGCAQRVREVPYVLSIQDKTGIRDLLLYLNVSLPININKQTYNSSS